LLTLAITKSKERKSKNVCILEVKLRRLERKIVREQISAITNNILYLRARHTIEIECK